MEALALLELVREFPGTRAWFTFSCKVRGGRERERKREREREGGREGERKREGGRKEGSYGQAQGESL